MLKIVEQLEIVSSSVNEAFVTVKDSRPIHDAIHEMEQYGMKREKEILSSCHLQLKHSVVGLIEASNL